MEMEFNMLTGAVYNELKLRGLPTDNIDALTPSQIAQVKAILDGDDSEGHKTDAIRVIISKWADLPGVRAHRRRTRPERPPLPGGLSHWAPRGLKSSADAAAPKRTTHPGSARHPGPVTSRSSHETVSSMT